jgi:ATP-dependent RNA helicase RhlE
MSFQDLQLINPLLKSIEEQGYTIPTEVQRQTIPHVLAKKDVIVTAQTGTGKTAAFALPILQQLFENQDAPKGGKTIKALIVSPTRELALQIGNNFKAYGRHTNLRTTVIFGGISDKPQIDVLTKGVDILVATPGRLIDLQKQNIVDLGDVEILVLDEADLMLDMGFIDDVKRIESLCPEDKQILLFSATMPFKVEQLANSILKTPQRIEVTATSSAAKTVSQVLYYVPKRNKMELCLHLLRNDIKGSILIFRRTKFGVDKLETTLTKNGYKVDTLHGDKSQTDRQEALKKFKNGLVDILIATDVAARGIDINELDVVINFDLPNIPETYVHRIGRTGRAGQNGLAYSFCSADEKAYVKTIEQLIQKEIPVEENHPYPLDPKAKAIIHKSKQSDSKHKKGRKSKASKKKKRRWY